MKSMMALLACVFFTLLAIGAARADTPVAREFPPGLQVPEAARAGPNFDVDKATQAYIELLTPEQRALSDAYFEGGYWLELWGFLYGLGVSAVLLYTGWARRMREVAFRIAKRTWPATALTVAFWLLAGYLLSLPLSLYVDYFREHQYGLATQTLAPWFGDQFKGLALGIVFGAPVIALIYSAVRRARENWWVWAGVITFVFILFVGLISPVFIAPLFNDYKPLPAGEVHDAIYSLARANGIPTDNVAWFDASRQTTRVSANVSGFLGTTQVSLNDNLLDKTSLPEIKAVMGHEMGHYVLNHGFRLSLYLGLVFLLGFYFTHRGLDFMLARWGSRWGITDRGDPAGLPLIAAIFSLYMFLMTPVTNTIVRQAEAEADMYGIDAAREPHGFAMAAMRLSTYRKIAPGPLEEFLFYDHPSGYARVHMSMRWFAENQDTPIAEGKAP